MNITAGLRKKWRWLIPLSGVIIVAVVVTLCLVLLPGRSVARPPARSPATSEPMSAEQFQAETQRLEDEAAKVGEIGPELVPISPTSSITVSPAVLARIDEAGQSLADQLASVTRPIAARMLANTQSEEQVHDDGESAEHDNVRVIPFDEKTIELLLEFLESISGNGGPIAVWPLEANLALGSAAFSSGAYKMDVFLMFLGKVLDRSVFRDMRLVNSSGEKPLDVMSSWVSTFTSNDRAVSAASRCTVGLGCTTESVKNLDIEYRWASLLVQAIGSEMERAINGGAATAVSHLDEGVAYFSTSTGGVETHVPLACFPRLIMFWLNALKDPGHRKRAFATVSALATFRSHFPQCGHVIVSNRSRKERTGFDSETVSDGVSEVLPYKRIALLDGFDSITFILYSLGLTVERLRADSSRFASMVVENGHAISEKLTSGEHGTSDSTKRNRPEGRHLTQLTMPFSNGLFLETTNVLDGSLLKKFLNHELSTKFKDIVSSVPMFPATESFMQTTVLCAIYPDTPLKEWGQSFVMVPVEQLFALMLHPEELQEILLFNIVNGKSTLATRKQIN